jgi:hypothetical protein
MSAFHKSTPIPCIPLDGPINTPDPFSGLWALAADYYANGKKREVESGMEGERNPPYEHKTPSRNITAVKAQGL